MLWDTGNYRYAKNATYDSHFVSKPHKRQIEKMKIAIIDPPSFTPWRNYSLCSALEKAGYEVTLFTSEFIYDSTLEGLRTKGVKYFFLRLSTKIQTIFPAIKGSSFVKAIKGAEYCFDLVRLYRYLNKNKYTVAHIEWPVIPPIDLYFIKLLKKKGIKVSLTIHNLLSSPTYDRQYITKRYMRKIYSEADLLMPLTETTKKIFIEETGIRGEKIKTVRHGNFDIFRIGRCTGRLQAKKEFGIDPESDLILFFGLIRYYKGLKYLLKALRIAVSENKRIKLLVAGRIFASEERLDEYDELKDLRDHIIIHPRFIPTTEVEKYFVACDIVVMPYIHNLHSGQHHLAYTFGRPVIATACGDSLEIVQDGKGGFLVPPEDENALARAIINFFNFDKKKREEMNQYCRSLSDGNSWEKAARDLIGAYKDFFNNGGTKEYR